MEGFPKPTSALEREDSGSEYGPKSEGQRYRLRQTLLALGVAVTAALPEQDAKTEGKQGFGSEGRVAALSNTDNGPAEHNMQTTADGVQYEMKSIKDTSSTSEAAAASSETQAESAEASSESPHHEAYTKAAAAAYTMRRDQVVLTDTWGKMLVDEPVDLHDAAGYTPEEMTWRYQGGTPVGIPGMLLEELRTGASTEHNLPTADIIVRHEYLGMLKDEFAEYASLQEVALHNANQEVPGDTEGRTFLEVIADEFEAPIAGADGALLSELLKEYIPALASKESLFNVEAVSSAGARGAMQFMPEAWEKYAPEGADPTSFVEAVQAAGNYFAASYEYLYNNSLNELDVIESEFFAGDHEAFVRDFVLLCLINGYNAGDGTMRQALEHFTREHGTQADLQAFYKTTEQVGGRDVFFAFTRIEAANDEVSMYGPYASAYALEIDARKQAGTTLPETTDRDTEQFAQLR